MQTNDVAIIGYAARLPGAASAARAWAVMSAGACTIGTIPETRWASGRFYNASRAVRGKAYVRRAGLIDEPFHFDAGYFGISPFEASQMDPQQRILLETVAHAFDHAGINPDRLDAERTGVYVGASAADHSTTALQDPELIEAHYILGNTLSILANRISYQWNLKGPSYVVDVACASSLFALDQAVTAIRSGAVDTAVVAGVNILLSPVPFVGFSKARMLSADGLCKAFASDADGYVRSEGAVVFVLRRADLARAGGDQIRSTIIATGTNTDGRTSSITVPSGGRQTALLQAVLGQAGIDPDAIAYLEAHGTGTPVGDPIEASAIGAAYGKPRTRPLPIGSSKTNFGHLEPVSGLVGLLKVQLVLENGEIPASLHADTLNTNIDFAGLNLDVTRRPRRLDERGEPWCAAVNSFGFGGANAHAIIRGPDRPEKARTDMPPPALRLTAASKTALRDLAAGWRDRVGEIGEGLATAVANANHRTALRDYRVCFPAATADALRDGLDAFVKAGDSAAAPTIRQAIRDPARVAFVFSGNGAVWPGMARHLLDSDDVFRTSVSLTAQCYRDLGGFDILDALASASAEDLRDAGTAQPLLFAVQIGLSTSLKHRGLHPHAVLGHSVGEIAAAHTAGAIPLETALSIILTRSARFAPLRGTGAMAALAASRDTARDLIRDLRGAVEIAAENSPQSVTLSGPSESLNRLLSAARDRRIAGKMLPIDYPYHSSALDGIEAALLQDLAGVEGKPSEADFYSACLGARVGGEDLGAAYWWQNARGMVRFREAVERMAADGCGVFIEISPRSVLQNYLRDSLRDSERACAVLGSLENRRAEEISAQSIALDALSAGAAVDETALLGPDRPFRATLPPYPFDRRLFELRAEKGLDIFGRGQTHPLLGAQLSSDSPTWTGDLSLGLQPWLGDHRVDGRVYFPATGLVEIMLAAADRVAGPASGDHHPELRNLEILRPIVLKDDQPVAIRTTYEPSMRKVTIQLREASGWETVAFAFVFAGSGCAAAPVRLQTGIAGTALYERLGEAGLDYGSAFALVESWAIAGNRADAALRNPHPDNSLLLDPTAADAGMHSLAVLARRANLPADLLFLPGRMGRVRRYSDRPVAGARAVLVSADASGICAEITYVDDNGHAVAEIGELRLRPMPRRRTVHDGLLWEEISVPVGPGKDCNARAAVCLHEAGADAPVSDLDVIRGAIAGRLAWDRVAEPAALPGTDPALRILADHGCIAPDGDEATGPAGACPWPDLETLLDLLVKCVPAAQTELRAALGVRTGKPVRLPPALSNTNAAARAISRDLQLAGARVTMLGAPDIDLVSSIAAVAGHVTICAETQAALDDLRLAFGGVQRLHFATLAAAAKTGKADLVFGIDVAAAFTRDGLRRVADLPRPGGEVLLVERGSDDFEQITGTSGSDAALKQVRAAVGAKKVPLSDSAWCHTNSVRLLCGVAVSVTQEKAVPPLNVAGIGKLADALRRLPGGDGEATKLLVIEAARDIEETALIQAGAFETALAAGDIGWIVQDGLLGQASLNGWRRTIANETGRDIRTIAVGKGVAPKDVAALIASSGEPELVATADGIRAPRVVPLDDPEPVVTGEARSVLHRARRGPAPLVWRNEQRRPPEPGEVEIAVAATGLNFRDTLLAQGLLPADMIDKGFAGPHLGMECSGTVTRAAAGARFRPGDPVIAFTRSAFCSHVIARDDCVMALPAGVDPRAGAAIPVAFLTADYALREVARLARDETVLIHAAAGGVGIAAVQVAHQIGAKVIATAGSTEKRHYLRSLGVAHTLDSRSAAFSDQVAELTGGRGVDVVLNSIAGEMAERSLACLAPFGRFVELGKRDFAANSGMGLRALANNITYHAVDLDQLPVYRPDGIPAILEQLRQAFAAEQLSAPPISVFAGHDVTAAFRFMQKSGHIGKIVVTPRAPENIRRPAGRPIRGVWLVTGGTRGFGLKTAGWLARRGATEIWLVSRSGEIAPDDLTALQESGATVVVRACDVTCETATGALLEEIGRTGSGLSGVVHAAMTLDDALFDNLDERRLRNVIAPKLRGARNLDQLTRDTRLDHFWLFGSVVARFGSHGQAAYVAANAGLEELCAARRTAGLPALAIAWGPITDAGYLARHDRTRSVVEQQFGTLLGADEALDTLGRLINRIGDRSAITIAPANWAQLRRNAPVLDGPLFEFVNVHEAAGAAAGALDLRALVAEQGEAAARETVREMLKTEAARILQMPPSEIEPLRPLTEYGFDSLMAVTLAMSSDERFGITLSPGAAGAELTLDHLSRLIVQSAVSGGAQDDLAEMRDRHLTKTQISSETKKQISESDY